MQYELLPGTIGATEALSPEDFARCFGEPLGPKTKQVVHAGTFSYAELSPEERDYCIRAIVERLVDPAWDQSGAHRLEKWEKGWGENLDALMKASDKDFLSALMPKYFDKYDVVRFDGRFVRVKEPDFEYRMLRVILAWVFEKYMASAQSIYEFGCGTGHNLLWAREFNAHARLVGLDWAVASQNIIGEMVRRGFLHNAEGKRFDFFNPDTSVSIVPESTVLTVAALEQVGEASNHFLEYLISQKPKLVIHVEPMAELFDSMNLLDSLAIAYYKKRNWLWGLLGNLRKLEAQRKIVIHDARRTHLGHFLTDGYSVAVWSPRS